MRAEQSQQLVLLRRQLGLLLTNGQQLLLCIEDEVANMNVYLPTGLHDSYINLIKQHLAPVVVKYGRFVPDCQPHYDEVLGVNLSSDNQYAKRYDNEIQDN